MEAEIAQLEALVARAKRVPLTPQVRVRRGDLDEAVAALREAAASSSDGWARTAIGRQVEAVEEIAASARLVPLTPEVRFDAEAMRTELAELRRLLPELG